MAVKVFHGTFNESLTLEDIQVGQGRRFYVTDSEEYALTYGDYLLTLDWDGTGAVEHFPTEMNPAWSIIILDSIDGLKE